MPSTIHLALQFEDALDHLHLLAKLSERFPEVVKGALGSPEILRELVRFDLDRPAAPAAGQLRVRLEPTDFLRHLVSALRALDRQVGVVEEGHSQYS